SIDGLRIVGDWDSTCDLAAMIRQARPRVVAVLLNGPSAPGILEKISGILKEDPALKVLGVGLPNDPELLRSAMRGRLTELIDLPVDAEKLLSTLQSVAGGDHSSRPSGRLIAVRGTGGGCGATVLAANLAVELAKLDRGRTAVVDLDLHFGQIATMFDVSPAFTLSELAQQSEEYDQRVLDNAMARHSSGVSVLARPRDPDAPPISSAKLSAILTSLLDYHDWVVVDEGSRS